MDINETEKVIRTYQKLKKRIKILNNELESIKETGISALEFKLGGKSKTNTVNRVTENVALKNIENTKKLKKELFVLSKQVEIIDNALDSLDKTEREVIKYKLIEGLTYMDIADELSISVIYAKKLKKKALIKVKKIIS